jgi:hypothetical protein
MEPRRFTIENLQVGQHVVLVLGGGARVREIVSLHDAPSWKTIGCRPLLAGRRKADRHGVHDVIFAGSKSEAEAALTRYEAIREERRPEVERAQSRLTSAQGDLTALNGAVERQARLAAQEPA